MKFRSLIKIIPVLLFLMACKPTAYLTIEELAPAEVNIPLKIKHVAVVTHAVDNKNSPLIDHKEQKHAMNDLYKYLDEASRAYIDGLSDVIYTSPRYVFKEPAIINRDKSDHNKKLAKIDWPMVADICRDKGAEGLISVEYYSIIDTSAVMYLPKYYHYYAFLRLVNISLWRIYLPSDRVIADEYIVKDTILWEGFGGSPRKAMEDIPYTKDAIQLSCYDAAVKYGLRIAPVWDQTKRMYYTSGNKALRKAYKLAKDNKWKKAAAIWKKQLNAQDDIAFKAAFNLALAAEINDKLKVAKEWAERSYEIKKIPKTKTYIEILVERIRKKNTLIDQLP